MDRGPKNRSKLIQEQITPALVKPRAERPYRAYPMTSAAARGGRQTRAMRQLTKEKGFYHQRLALTSDRYGVLGATARPHVNLTRMSDRNADFWLQTLSMFFIV